MQLGSSLIILSSFDVYHGISSSLSTVQKTGWWPKRHQIQRMDAIQTSPLKLSPALNYHRNISCEFLIFFWKLISRLPFCSLIDIFLVLLSFSAVIAWSINESYLLWASLHKRQSWSTNQKDIWRKFKSHDELLFHDMRER